MEILHFEDLGDKSVIHLCIKFESNRTILKIWGIKVSFGCEHSSSSPRRVSNFNSKVAQGGIYLHIKFERDRWNIFRVSVHVV